MSNYLDVDDLIIKLKDKDTVQQTKSLTKFYIDARFKMSDSEFERNYVDGSNDGGLDFVYKQDSNCYFILQSKFTASPRKTNFKEIKLEIDKIIKTLLIENSNTKADEFINSLRREINNHDAFITINWLTTNILSEDVITEVRNLIKTYRIKHDILAVIEFIPIDKEEIDRAIYDYKHSFVPQTGIKKLPINAKECIKDINPETLINSAICKVKIIDILNLFKDKEDIKN